MCFKTNPWNVERDREGINDRGKFVNNSVKVYLYSGVVHWLDAEQDVRRATSDKIQDMQLLASKRARYQQFVLIIQFNDMIASAWLSDKADKAKGGFGEVCSVGSMARIKMERTIKETVFFIEQSDDGDCINSIEISSSKPRKLNVSTVYTLAGQTVVMLGSDDEDDVNNLQKLWVICDNQKVYQISNGVV